MNIFPRSLRMALRLALVALVGGLLVGLPSRSAEPAAEDLLRAVGCHHGLVVHIGATDGSLAESLVKQHPVLVHVLAADAAAEARLRRRFVTAGVHGQATAGRLMADIPLPLGDEVASVVVADLDATRGLNREEILRLLRPLGKAYLKAGGRWQAVSKPRSRDVDDWAQYYHDAATSDLSTDKIAGPARGLQWQIGPQDTHSDGVRVIGDLVIGHDTQGLWARDAFNGLPLWRQPGLLPATRFGWLVDAERIYIYPAGKAGAPGQCQIALDLRTGKTILEYQEGLTFSLPREMPRDKDAEKQVRQELRDRAKDFQARLIDGLLIQVSGPGLAVLDAKTGKRLWGAQTPEGLVWGHPLAAGDTLYAVQGAWARSHSYTHWPMTLVDRVVAFDLPTGKQRWLWEWKKEMPAYFAAEAKNDPDDNTRAVRRFGLEPAEQRAAAAYNMALDQGHLVFALRAELKSVWQGAGIVRQLVLNARTGRFVAYGRTPADRTAKDPGLIGHLHSGNRVLPVGGRWWFPNIVGVYGSVDPAAPTDAEKFERAYAKLLRPVACTVYRASPNYLFGSLTTYKLDGSEVQQTNAARTTCDVGAFPANGMTYITPNHCFCMPYLPGHNVFHPRRPREADDAGRLEPGTGEPASAVAAAGNDSWPMYLCDNLRSSWSGAKVPANLQAAWTIRPAQPLEGLVGQDWTNQWYGQGPVTGVSVAEGIGVLALTDRQEVVAIDPGTGQERWRAAVEGRIDSQPTIAKGAVYVGTRTGWLYAFQRDSGKRLWRFRAAPRRELIVVDGQLESPWPLFGTVTVTEQGVWAVAGRHNDCDGGLWWWRLDPATGQALARGRFGRDEMRGTTGNIGFEINVNWPNGANSPPVTDGKLFLMPRIPCKLEDGRLAVADLGNNPKAGEREYWENAYAAGILVPGNRGLLNRMDFLNGYKMSAFGFVQAKLFAYRGERFVCVGGTDGAAQHRGGSGGSWVRAFERKEKLGEVSVPNKNDPDRPIKNTVGAVMKWDNPMPLASRNGTEVLAVAGDAVLVGVSVTHSDRQRSPFRLLVLGLADGKQQQELALPARPILGGISAVAGRVYVTTADGTVTCFAAP
ncbi:MAG: PQQ-binding-like beta-propeller repeat protein [Planctomycetia bacterium]|nr:PQQ-binding-like beta-propeller repeat protein [Planctomycetia bacterium]